MNYQLVPLEWDSKYLGVKAARLELFGVVDSNDQDCIIELCKRYDFVTVVNSACLAENNAWIGKRTPAFLVDVNVQFQKEASLANQLNLSLDVSVSNQVPRNEGIVQLASESFDCSRFFNDPNITRVQAMMVYARWVESAFGQVDRYFVVSKSGEKTVGFLLFSLSDDAGIIELIAVDKASRGQRVGVSLLQAMEAFVVENGVHKVKVGTQISNVCAIRFYTAFGFKYSGCSSVYHLWNNQ